MPSHIKQFILLHFRRSYKLATHITTQKSTMVSSQIFFSPILLIFSRQQKKETKLLKKINQLIATSFSFSLSPSLSSPLFGCRSRISVSYYSGRHLRCISSSGLFFSLSFSWICFFLILSPDSKFASPRFDFSDPIKLLCWVQLSLTVLACFSQFE